MLIGASIGAEDLATYPQKLAGNHIMRIFPVDATIAGKAMKVLPAWTDARFTYCKNSNVIPFVSTKVDGDAGGIAHVKTQLQNMPAWVTQLYITDRHEPEGDVSAAAFQSNFNAFLAMIDSLPATIRAKIKCGPILTKTWTESNATGKGQFNYGTYDPGTGDFFAVDMYVATGSASAVVSPSTLPTAAAFAATFKAYRKTPSDTRPRWWPELGLIGMPADTDGTARANWLQSVYDEIKTWSPGAQGWTFAGLIWWNQIGKATGEVKDVGQARDFPLHLRSVPDPSKTYTDAQGKTHWISNAVDLPGSPPAPVAKFNALWTTENAGAGAPQPQNITVNTVTGVNAAQHLTVTGGSAPPPDTGGGNRWLLGATMKKADIAKYEPMLARNSFMRIFPNSDGLPPAWDDPRFLYCQRQGTVPFVSSNIDGDAAKFPTMRQWIINMPAWVKVLYLSDRHEPENNQKDGLTKELYKANFTAWWNQVILTLPATTRAKVQAGHILTRQYIEDPRKGADNYAEYDTGLGDFYGVDMYMDSWKPGSSENALLVADAYPNPVTFLSKFKAYRFTSSDTRDRVFPEWGAIGIPTDTDGALRANWIKGCIAELDSWTVAAQGWRFVGAIWWNNQGTTSPTSLNPIGTVRYFYLDIRQNGLNTIVVLPGSPPAPVAAYNQAALNHTTIGEATPTPDPPPPPDPTPDPDPPPPPDPTPDPNPEPTPPGPGDSSTLPADLPDAARFMASEYVLLFTDKYLNVLGDPIHNWLTIDLTLRFNEPSSGQFTVPGYPWVRQQVVPGGRVVCIRRVLGNAAVVLAGPVESSMYERADDGDKGGDGVLTVTWADDMAWIAARLSYPNPALTPETQTTDNWLFTGNAELGMRQLVDTNAGVNALPARQVPRLILGRLNNVGTNITIGKATAPTSTDPTAESTRFRPLTEVLRDMARKGGGLGFRTVQVMSGKTIEFEVFQPRDLTRDARFGFGLGNLKYISYEVSMPEVTIAIVGGQGDEPGSTRFVLERRNPVPETAWGRLETLVSMPGNDPVAELQDAGDKELADGGEGVRLSSNAADTVDQRYGVHYGLGDRVSIEVWEGQAVADIVQMVHIQAWPTAGEVVNTTVGSQAARHDAAFIRRMHAIDRRVGRLERRH